MSSAFDTMQHALLFLEERVLDDQALQVVKYLREIVDKFHDYSHAHQDELNRVAGTTPDLLRTAMRYDDPTEREMWLGRKGQ